jgi:hypothetical protein
MEERPMTDIPESEAQEPARFDAEYVRDLRAESKKWRLRARDAQAQLEELRSTTPATTPATPSGKSDGVDDLRGELEQLKAELAAERLGALRLRVATAAGLPVAFADRLRGEDEAALAADAESLKALIPNAEKGAASAPPPGAAPRSITSVPNGLPATGKTEEQLRAEYLGGGLRSSVPVTQEKQSPDGQSFVFTSR